MILQYKYNTNNHAMKTKRILPPWHPLTPSAGLAFADLSAWGGWDPTTTPVAAAKPSLPGSLRCLSWTKTHADLLMTTHLITGCDSKAGVCKAHESTAHLLGSCIFRVPILVIAFRALDWHAITTTEARNTRASHTNTAPPTPRPEKKPPPTAPSLSTSKRGCLQKNWRIAYLLHWYQNTQVGKVRVPFACLARNWTSKAPCAAFTPKSHWPRARPSASHVHTSKGTEFIRGYRRWTLPCYALALIDIDRIICSSQGMLWLPLLALSSLKLLCLETAENLIRVAHSSADKNEKLQGSHSQAS